MRDFKPSLVAFVFAAGVCGTPAMVSAAVVPVVSGTAHDALFAIAFHDAVGIAVGAGGAILESDDAGAHWKRVSPAPTPLALLGVGLAAGHALAVGQEGTVLVMDADGKWVKVDSGTHERLFNVAVNAAGRAVAVGSFGTVLASDDGGVHWASIAPDWTHYTDNGEQPHLYAVVIDDHDGITIAGEFGLILKSADGGKTWSLRHRGEASLFGLQLRGDGVGYAVGQDGTVLRTADHGETWNALDTGSHAILLDVESRLDGHVVVTGMHDLLTSADEGKSWTHSGGEAVTASWLAGVAAVPTQSAVLAVGLAGQIVRIDH